MAFQWKKWRHGFLGVAVVAAALVMAVVLTSRTSDAKGPPGFCKQEVAFDNGEKYKVETRLNSSNAVPLSRTSESQVDNGGAFEGGQATVALVALPAGASTFNGIQLNLNEDCTFAEPAVQFLFDTGPVEAGDDSLDPDNAQAQYEAAQAVAGWPTSAWDDDELTLARNICQEVHDALSGAGNPSILKAMRTAASVGTAAGLASVHEAMCLATEAGLVTQVGGPDGGCNLDEILSSDAMLAASIADIGAFGPVSVSFESSGNSDVSITLDDGEGCTTTCTVDLSQPECLDADCNSSGCD